MDMKCYCKILCISYTDHFTNAEVRAKIQQAIGPHEDFLTIVKRRKLKWYEHVSSSLGLAKPILQGTLKGGRLLVSRCFEPSQALGITSGLNTNSNLFLSYFAHKKFNTNHNTSIAQSFQTYLKRGRRQGRQKKKWEDNLKEWLGLEIPSSKRICGVPTTLVVKG